MFAWIKLYLDDFDRDGDERWLAECLDYYMDRIESFKDTVLFPGHPLYQRWVAYQQRA